MTYTDYVIDTRDPLAVSRFLKTIPKDVAFATMFGPIGGGYILRIFSSPAIILHALCQQSFGIIVGRLCPDCRSSILDNVGVCFVCKSMKTKEK